MFSVITFSSPGQAFYTRPAIFKTMPKYAVVVCPDCKNAFIIEPGHKTVSCRSCNKRLDAARLKVFLATDDFKEAQTARGSMVAKISGDTAAFEEAVSRMDRDVMERIGEDIQEQRYMEDKRKVNEKMDEEARKTKKKGQQAILRDTFEELAEKGDIDIEEYWRKISFTGIDRLKFDQWVEKMVETGAAYSPRYGYIRKC
jgi:DNA replicative helicase MCM subunit Mcm2 (Cdc46/Mcm family)